MILRLKIFLNYSYILIFVFVLVFPSINSRLNIFKDSEFTEKRTLAEKPVVSTVDQAGGFVGFGYIFDQLKSYPNEYKEYLSDNLNLRNRLISYNKLLEFKTSLVNSQFFGYTVDDQGYIEDNVSDGGKVIVTKDGWWWRVVPDVARTDSFTEDQLENYAKEIQARSDYLKKKGIVYVYGVYPGKRTIYPEYLPEGAKSVNMRGRQILQYLEMHTDVITVDPYDAIIEEKDNKAKEGKIIYKKTDTHWNSDGAFVGYTEVANVVKQYVDISVSTKDDFDITIDNTTSGDIVNFAALKESFKEPNNPIYSYKHPNNIINTLDYDSSDFVVYSNGDVQNNISVMLLGDSYTAPSIVRFEDNPYKAFGPMQFWAQSTSEVIYKRDYIGFDTVFIDQYSPDVVVQTVVDYLLYYIDSTNYITPELY